MQLRAETRSDGLADAAFLQPVLLRIPLHPESRSGSVKTRVACGCAALVLHHAHTPLAALPLCHVPVLPTLQNTRCHPFSQASLTKGDPQVYRNNREVDELCRDPDAPQRLEVLPHVSRALFKGRLPSAPLHRPSQQVEAREVEDRMAAKEGRGKVA